MLKTAWERLLVSFMLVAATVLKKGKMLLLWVHITVSYICVHRSLSAPVIHQLFHPLINEFINPLINEFINHNHITHLTSTNRLVNLSLTIGLVLSPGLVSRVHQVLDVVVGGDG